MIELNPDYESIKNLCPGYITKLRNFDKEIFSKFNCLLGMEFDDHSNSSLHFWLQNSKRRLEENELNFELRNLLENLEKNLKSTCSQCGSNHKVSFRNKLYKSNSHYINQLVLCVECFENYHKEEFRLSVSSYIIFSQQNFFIYFDRIQNKHFTRKKIRFINFHGDFDYAKFGTYFFYKEGLYVITNKLFYKAFDIKEKFIDTIFYESINLDSYIIRAFYAGHDTEFRDDNGDRIYTGDIIKMKGTMVKERDPHKYFKKDRLISPHIENLFEVFGVVSSFEICPEAYQVVLDNHGAFLCHGTEMQRIGNIFYDLNPDEKIDIWGKACQIAQSGYSPGGFWRVHTRETVTENLKLIKTPSFTTTPDHT